MIRVRVYLVWSVLIGLSAPALAQPVTKYLWEFATPGGGGYPNDAINDHQAFVNAAAFFQARHGYGTLVLDSGEYIMGRQQLREPGDAVPVGWETSRYPAGSSSVPKCASLVANQIGFFLDSCFQFTIQGVENTSVRYRDCLYYGTFVRDANTGEVSSAVGRPDGAPGCLTCVDILHTEPYLNLGLRHAAVGSMFEFLHCDSIRLRDVELNGNIDAAILGGRINPDGIQTAYDGVVIRESSNCLLERVRAHHFGRDGLTLMDDFDGTAAEFLERYPGSVDSVDVDSTIVFNNTILNSAFNWNGRQGISWTGCAGLRLFNCDLNYNGAGRLASKPGSGLDIEGAGGPMRIRYGVFDSCRFLHNRLAGVISDDFQCLGQRDFRFNKCIFKSGAPDPGEESYALWPESRAMKFIDCKIYGKVEDMFERGENVLPHNPDDDLLFLRTQFYEEDSFYNYLGDFANADWSGDCTGEDPQKVDVTGGARHAAVVYDSCVFNTNCYGKVRFLGRSLNDLDYPYCPDCPDCNVPGNNCPPGSCVTSGPYQGDSTSVVDDRYVKLINCTLRNTGRLRCTDSTTIFSMALTTTTNLVVEMPTAVRGEEDTTDVYAVILSAITPFENCYPLYCDTPTVNRIDYHGEYPDCKPFFGLTDSVPQWSFCNGAAGNIPQAFCGTYTLSKTASTSQTYLDSTVTFTITVCNNTVFDDPVLLTEQLPPAFVVTSADTLWSGADTTLALNNGECAVLQVSGYFTAFGEHSNTVTLVTDTGVVDTLSAMATVNVQSTCEAELVIPDSSYASVVGTVFSGSSVNIQGLFVVDDDVLFQSCQVYLEGGAEIVVLPGYTLDIMGSTVESCNGVMWKGISARGGGGVRMRNSVVDDAENAVTATDGSTVWLRDNQFHNNRVSIHIPTTDLGWNNVVLYGQGNTFYSDGPMPVPYAGQSTALGKVGFAAAEVSNTTFSLIGGNNIIHSMSNGIVARKSDVQVSGCRFVEIAPDSVYTFSGNGSGIYATGRNGWNTLRQEGYGMEAEPSFEKCRWGIYTEYMNVHSTNNRMLEMGTAYRIDRSGYRDVDVLYNKVHTKYHGMDLRFNDGAAHILVEGNDITFGNDTECTQCRGFSGIQVSEGNYPSLNSRIIHNKIQFLPLAPSRLGISLTAADNWVVANNTVRMRDNALNLTGIQLKGCNRPTVSCNTITGGPNGLTQNAQAAIRNTMGSDVLLSCNELDSTANGILFNGVVTNVTEVRGNKLRRHKWALHLDSTAVIGGQNRRGNLWYNTPAAGGLGAWYEDSTNAGINLFLVNPTTISGGNTMPGSVVPSYWFNPDFGANYDCADDEGEDYCSQFKERGIESLTELDKRVAQDSLENDPYTAETIWMLKSRLYKKLQENPELQDSLHTMADLYSQLQGTATEDLKEIEDGQLILYDLDSTVVLQLHQSRSLMDSLLALVHESMELVEDSMLSSSQQQAILADANEQRSHLRELAISNALQLEVASSSKALDAAGLQAANTGILADELIVENQKIVNEIYLTTIGKDLDVFTTEQIAALFAIAEQCPMLGGNAVFKARSLYWQIDDGHDFDDGAICLPYGINVKRLTPERADHASLIPNPASDEVTLILARPLEVPNLFVLYNALGAEALSQIVPSDLQRMVIHTTSLAPALYHYQVRGPSGVIGEGKLSIIR